MKKVLYTIIFVLSVFTINAQITPTNGYVYVKSDGTGNGSSWANATSDLQGAIDATGAVRIWVAEGTYYPTWHWDAGDPRAFSFKMKNNVTILGGFPNTGNPEATDRDYITHKVILSGDLGVIGDYSDNAYHVIYNIYSLELNESAYLGGVNINFGNANVEDGDNYRGGGVFNENCNCKFYNCVIALNHGNRGAGMYNWKSSPFLGLVEIRHNQSADIGGGILNSKESSPTLSSCYIISNTAVINGAGIANVEDCNPWIKGSYIVGNISDGSAGGILNADNSNAIIQACEIFENKAAEYGAGILNDNSKPVIVNCIIADNRAGIAGGGIVNNNFSNASIINNTIVYNYAVMLGATIANSDSNPYITNCILWANESGIVNQGTSSPIVTYSCVYGGHAGIGNISVDPLLESDESPNFHLNYSSPAIDAGINDSIPEGIENDYFANNRIINGVVDMGAYESSGIIYVEQSATGNQTGLSWYDAFTSLESALDVALAGNSIWVAAGTYMPSNNHGLGVGDKYNTFLLKSDVKVIGGFAGNEYFETQRDWILNKTYLEGNLGVEKVYHVVTADANCNEETILDGFIVQNGNANGNDDFRYGGNIYVSESSPQFKNLDVKKGNCNFQGGNVYIKNSDALFSNCGISEGYTSYRGGGIALSNSSSVFTKCNIGYNSAADIGGAVSIEAGGVPVFLDCSFNENFTNWGLGLGSGAVFYIDATVDTVIIVNCYFSENIASASGGVMHIAGKTIIVNSNFTTNYVEDTGGKGGHLFIKSGADVEIYNSVFYDGFSDLGEQLFVESGAQVSISHSMISGCGGSGAAWDTNLGTDAGGNIDYHTYWSSFQQAIDDEWPGIDAGSAEVYGNILQLEIVGTDADGYTRMRGEAIDMGYHELPYCLIKVIIQPNEIITNAAWSYDAGINWFMSNESVWAGAADISIEFDDVQGYTKPEIIYLSMDWGGNYYLMAEYVLFSELKPVINQNFSVYPNPTSGLITVEAIDVMGITNICLISTDGKIIDTQVFVGHNSFDVQNLKAGLYFIRAGENTIKIIKQ